MNSKRNLGFILLSQIVFISCQTKTLASEVPDLQASAENICEPGSRYIGNYITDEKRTYGTGNERFHETFIHSILPAKYQWVDGQREGTSIKYHLIPPKYKTETAVFEIPVRKCPPKETGIECDENTKLVKKEIVKQVLIEPLRIEKCEAPFLYKDGKTRIVVQPSKVKSTLLTY